MGCGLFLVDAQEIQQQEEIGYIGRQRNGFLKRFGCDDAAAFLDVENLQIESESSSETLRLLGCTGK